MVLSSDRFAADKAIVVGNDGNIRFHIESDNLADHAMPITLSGRKIALDIKHGAGAVVIEE